MSSRVLAQALQPAPDAPVTADGHAARPAGEGLATNRMTVPIKTEPIVDHVLVARMASGDERAVQLLMDRHGAALFALARSILQDARDAEEVAGDAFHQAWRTAGGFDPTRASVIAWLAMITRSRALDRLRTRKDRATPAADDSAQDTAVRPEDQPDRELEASEARTLVGRALGDLPEPQRRVIELAYFGGLSQSEIAERLAVPLGTVKTRTLSAMKRLRELLAPLLREEVA